LAGPLKGRVIPTLDVEISDGESFSVRGIGLDDAMAIYYRHEGELSEWFDRIAGLGNGGPALSLTQTGAIGQTLINSIPGLGGEIIAAGSGSLDDETVAIARALPLGAQADALAKIGQLTFTRAMPPKKFLETVIRAVQGALPHPTTSPAA
jgi:hypothetical protein